MVLAVPEVVRTPFVAESVLAGLPTKSVAPRPRVIAPRVSKAGCVPLLVITMSDAPVPRVVDAKVWVVAAAAATRRRRPLPLPRLASCVASSWVPTCGAETPPMMRTDEAEMRLEVTVRAVVVVAPLAVKVWVKLSASVLILLGPPAVTPGAPAMMVVAPV